MLESSSAPGVGGMAARVVVVQVPAWSEPEWRQVVEACWEAAPDARCALPDLARQLEAILAACT